MTSGSHSGLAPDAVLGANLNGQTLRPTTNASRLFTSNVPSSWTDAFLGFEVPTTVLQTSGGANVLTITLDSGAFVLEGWGSHLVHMDLQLPARTHTLLQKDGGTEYANEAV